MFYICRLMNFSTASDLNEKINESTLQKRPEQFNINAKRLYYRNYQIKLKENLNYDRNKHVGYKSGNSVTGSIAEPIGLRGVGEKPQSHYLHRNAMLLLLRFATKVGLCMHHQTLNISLVKRKYLIKLSVWQGTQDSLQWHWQKATLTFQKQSCVKY